MFPKLRRLVLAALLSTLLLCSGCTSLGDTIGIPAYVNTLTGHSGTNGEADGSATAAGISDGASGDGTRARRRRRRPRKSAGATAAAN